MTRTNVLIFLVVATAAMACEEKLPRLEYTGPPIRVQTAQTPGEDSPSNHALVNVIRANVAKITWSYLDQVITVNNENPGKIFVRIATYRDEFEKEVTPGSRVITNLSFSPGEVVSVYVQRYLVDKGVTYSDIYQRLYALGK